MATLIAPNETHGQWTTFSGQAQNQNFNYLATNVTTDDSTGWPFVVFKPFITVDGNYSVTLFTPGCLQDSTCNRRASVDISGIMGSDGAGLNSRANATVAQNNNFNKYDQIYFGVMNQSTENFEPAVTLAPSPNASAPFLVVAQAVRVALLAVDETPNNGTGSQSSDSASATSSGVSATTPGAPRVVTATVPARAGSVSNELSTGAKAGLGVAVGVAGLLFIVLAIVLYLWYRRRKGRGLGEARSSWWQKSELQGDQSFKKDGGSGAGGKGPLYEVEGKEVHELGADTLPAEAPAGSTRRDET